MRTAYPPRLYPVRLGSDLWKFPQEKQATRHRNKLRRLFLERLEDLNAYRSRLGIIYFLAEETLGPYLASNCAVKLNEVNEMALFCQGPRPDVYKWAKMRTAYVLLDQVSEIILDEAKKKREDSVRRSIRTFRRNLRDTVLRQTSDLDVLRRIPEFQTQINRLQYGQN